jgi:hypothetical protein
MGGKAFSDLGAETIRVPTERMAPIARAIADALGAGMVRWPRDKADHGDIDLVVSAQLVGHIGDAELARRAGEAAGYPYISRRLDVRDPILFVGLQLPEGLVQVDLISSPDELLDFATRYLCWGDAGSMIGRLAREMGLTFGQNGLRCPVRVPGATKESLLLTTSFDEAVRFLGWDPAVHDAGFANDQEIAGFIASGTYFDPKVYEEQRTSSSARRRGKVRKGRSSFIDDVTARMGRFVWPEVKGPNPLQEAFTDKALEHFGKQAEYETIRQRMAASREIKQLAFTPEAVVAATGAPREDFSAIASVISESFPEPDEFRVWKETCSPDDLAQRATDALAILKTRRAEAAARQAIHLADVERGRKRREARKG